MLFARLLAGVLLVVVGRNLFWLVVAALGFAAAATLTAGLLQGQSELLVLGLSLVIGVIGAVVAIGLQPLGAALAGALAGGVLLTGLADMLGQTNGTLVWVLFVVGAVLGAIIVLALFDWALIVLTSAAGATLIARSLPLGPVVGFVVFAVALAAGVIIQSRTVRRTKS